MDGNVSAETYRFQVGNLECLAVSDGGFTYGPPAFPPPAVLLFANASPADREETLRRHRLHSKDWTEWVSPYICLVINAGGRLALVDTGAGSLGPNTGRLLANLRVAGIEPTAIDTVILTHAHPDHIGGNTQAGGTVTFPGARFVMWKEEWQFWTSGAAAATLEEHMRPLLMRVAGQNLPPIQSQLELVDYDREVFPGVSAVAAPGHTPGHMALAISSGVGQLLVIGDAALHPVHVERPDWHAVFDCAPAQAEATRRRLWSWATSQQALVMAFHFPFPGLGRVSSGRRGWEWTPAPL
jgi:glyoxylase-like metal-dependent hydrolase (beta-lactamase superfamily II)